MIHAKSTTSTTITSPTPSTSTSTSSFSSPNNQANCVVQPASASPCVSTAHYAASNRRAAPRRTARKSPSFNVPLINCLPALLIVLNTALDNRAERGERWLAAASASCGPLDLGLLVPLVPKPMLSALTVPDIGCMYRAALRVSRSPFDLLSGSATLHGVVHHIVRHSNVSPSALVIAVIYIDRLTTAMPHMFVTRTNIQRLFAVAFVLAAKWLEDICFPSNCFAHFFGMHPAELGHLESCFAAAIQYRLFVSTEQFHDAQVALMAAALDSDSGLHVFHTLIRHKIAFVQRALHMAPSWKEPAVQPLVPPDNAMVWGKVWQTAGRLVEMPGEESSPEDEPDDAIGCDCIRVERRMVRGQEVVQELARVQLAHDFSVTPEGLFARHWHRYFTEKGLLRYAKLDRIASDEWVEDLVLPALEHPEQPESSWWPRGEASPGEEDVRNKCAIDLEAFIVQAASTPGLSAGRTLAPD